LLLRVVVDQELKAAAELAAWSTLLLKAWLQLLIL
jgi:hypothetical protein